MDRIIQCGICRRITFPAGGFMIGFKDDSLVMTKCGHVYHRLCLHQLHQWDKTEYSRCPTCNLWPAEENDTIFDDNLPGTSAMALAAMAAVTPTPVQSAPSENVDHTIKIVLVGDCGVGKSCLLQALHTGSYSIVPATVGLDISFKSMEMAGKSVKLALWEVPGQRQFRGMVPVYFRSASGVCLIYDVTHPETLRSIAKWWKLAKKYGKPGMSFMLVGTKTDAVNQRRVSIAEGQKLARQLRVDFIETSAKNNVNVEAAFDSLVSSIAERGWGETFDASSKTTVTFSPDTKQEPPAVVAEVTEQ